MKIFSKATDILRANINDMLEHAEDPEKMYNLMLSDMHEMRAQQATAVAQSKVALHVAQGYLDEAKADVVTWGNRAAEQAKSKNDDLARKALANQITAENRVKELQASYDSSKENTDNLVTSLQALDGKLNELDAKRALIAVRSRVAAAQSAIHAPMSHLTHNPMDPDAVLNRVEIQLRQKEAEAAVAAEGGVQFAPLSDEAQFEQDAAKSEVEARLAALKGSMAAA